MLEIENESKKSGNKQNFDLWIGYIYLKNNQIEKAEFHFNGILKLLLKQIDSNHLNTQGYYPYLSLAYVYAAKGEKRNAIENLKMLKNRQTNNLWLVTCLKNIPFLDNIRDEPEFEDILKDAEAKYLKEHNRAGELIKEYESEEE